jgi:hypothetical protein
MTPTSQGPHTSATEYLFRRVHSIANCAVQIPRLSLNMNWRTVRLFQSDPDRELFPCCSSIVI